MIDINIQMQDSQGNVIHPETSSSNVIHKKEYMDKTLDKLEAREETFIQEVNPVKKGLWINTKNKPTHLENSGVIDRIKEYFDGKIGILSNLLTKNKSDVVQAINEVYENPSNVNLAKNGAFQINTLGKIEYNQNAKQCFDCWELSNRNLVNSEDVGKVILHDGYIELTGFGDKQLFISQNIDCYKMLAEKTVYLSADFKVNNMTQGGVFLQIGNNIRTDKVVFDKNNLNSEWKRKTLRVDIPSNITNINILLGSFLSTDGGYISTLNSDCSLFIKNVKLELGDRATPFIHKSYEEEFNNCLPYRNVLSNPNLLINGDFQVWQRGTNFTLSNYFMYTCDRWCVWSQSNGQSIVINDDGITLNSHGDESVMQMVENPKINKGKEMTFSVMLNIPVGSSVKIRVDQTENNTMIGSSKNRVEKTYNGSGKYEIATLSVPTNTTNNDYIRVLISANNDCNGKQIKVKYSKLELGSVATPFIPRSYGEELVLCQRYYQRYMTKGAVYDTNNLIINEMFTVSMRTRPTVKITNDILFDINQFKEIQFTISSLNVYSEYIGNILSNENNLVKGNLYVVALILDAEIY